MPDRAAAAMRAAWRRDGGWHPKQDPADQEKEKAVSEDDGAIHPAAQGILDRRKRAAQEYLRIKNMPAAEFEQLIRERDAARLRGMPPTGPQPGPAEPPSPAPAAPIRTRRQQLHDSQWPEGGRHRAQEAGDMSGPVGDRRGSQARRVGPATGHPRSAGVRGTMSGTSGHGSLAGQGGGHGIQSMAEDFPRVVHQGKRALEEGAAALRLQVAAIVDGSPSHQAVKDAANEWAQQAEALAARGDDLIGLSRQADAVGYEAQERYGSATNRGAWVDMGG